VMTTCSPFPYTTLFRSFCRARASRFSSVCRKSGSSTLHQKISCPRVRIFLPLMRQQNVIRATEILSLFGFESPLRAMQLTHEIRSEEHTSELQSPVHLV